MSRLPIPGSDKGNWGDVLNDYLSQTLNADGTLKNGIVTAVKLDTPSQAALAKAGTSVQIGGDLSGSTTAPTVSKIQGTGVSASVPTNGQVLQYSTASSAWVPGTVSSTTITDATTSAKGIVMLAGDLAGTASAPTVPGLTVKAPLASPTFTGTVTVPTPINNSDAATKSYVDTTAAAGAPDANSSTKGKIQLANDFGGTAAAPTVVSTHLSSALPVNQGGTGSPTQNFVDLSTAQTVAGNKTFSGTTVHTGTLTVATPTNNTDAASKSYVDSAVSSATGGSAIALTAVAVQSASFTAAINTIVPVSASSAITVTLPTAPSDKSRITVKKIDASVNVVTIATNGSDVFNKASGSTSLTLQVANQAVSLQYASSGALWYVVSDDVPASWVVLGVTKAVTGTYTLTNSDHVLLANTSASSFAVTLPTAIGYFGRFTITETSGSSTYFVTVGTTSSQTINGVSTVTVGSQASGASYSSVDVVSDGANWRIV